MANYTYPHVEVEVKARQRTTPVVAESTATTLLAPFICDRGPTNELVAIDSMADFINTYGQLDFSNENQRQINNIGKWLSSGGRVLACRLVGSYKRPKIKKITKEDAFSSESDLEISEGHITYDYNGQLISLGYSRKYSMLMLKYTDNELEPHVEKKYCISLDNAMEWADRAASEDTYFDRENHVLFVSGTDTSYDIFKCITNSGGKADDFVNDEDGTIKDNVGIRIEPSTEFSDSNNGVLKGYICLYTDSLTIKTPIDCAYCYTESDDTKKSYNIAHNDYVIYKNADTKDNYKLCVKAKYIGTFYNSVQVVISSRYSSSDNIYFNITVQTVNGSKISKVEQYNNVEFNKLYTIGATSKYIGNIQLKKYNDTKEKSIIEYIDDVEESERTKIIGYLKSCFSSATTLCLSGADSNGLESGETIEDILVDELKMVLSRPLETPFRDFFDCGYSKQTKIDLIELFCTVTDSLAKTVRNDAFLHLCDVYYNESGDIEYIPESEIRTSTANGYPVDLSNAEIMHHYCKETDIYSKRSGKEIKIPLLTYKAALIPYVDRVYGPHHPIAGLTYGLIPSTCTYIDDLPTEVEKQDYFDRHINYAEADSRNRAFMTDLTASLDNTSLIFGNNSRTLLLIKYNLTMMLREYLHETNDRVTKNNLENKLNSYLAMWVQNRALEFGYVTIFDSSDDPTLSDEQLGVVLDAKFKNVINVISTTIIV